jgi:hypothetical protein
MCLFLDNPISPWEHYNATVEPGEIEMHRLPVRVEDKSRVWGILLFTNGLFPSGFPTKALHALLFCPILSSLI